MEINLENSENNRNGEVKMTVNIEKLENDTYGALKQYFESKQSNTDNESKRFSTIPPGMISMVLETLVAPVITTLIADYIIRKYASYKQTKEERQKAEQLKETANRKIEKNLKKVGKSNDAYAIIRYVSENVTIELKCTPNEISRVLSELESYNH